MAFFYKHHAEALNKGAFPYTGNTGHSQTNGFSCIREQTIENRPCKILVGWMGTLDERYGFCQYPPVSFKDSLDIILRISWNFFFRHMNSGSWSLIRTRNFAVRTSKPDVLFS